jgi:hypothetical protein
MAPTKLKYETSHALVGEFIFNWNRFEGKISQCIERLFRLKGLESVIFLANIGFGEKIAVLTKIVELNTRGKSAKWRTEAAKLFSEVLYFNTEYRNVLVHTPFAPFEKAGGIKFYRILAKKKLDFPNTSWDRKFFEKRFKEIDGFEARLNEIMNALKDKSVQGGKRMGRTIAAAKR